MGRVTGLLALGVALVAMLAAAASATAATYVVTNKEGLEEPSPVSVEVVSKVVARAHIGYLVIGSLKIVCASSVGETETPVSWHESPVFPLRLQLGGCQTKGSKKPVTVSAFDAVFHANKRPGAGAKKKPVTEFGTSFAGTGTESSIGGGAIEVSVAGECTVTIPAQSPEDLGVIELGARDRAGFVGGHQKLLGEGPRLKKLHYESSGGPCGPSSANKGELEFSIQFVADEANLTENF